VVDRKARNGYAELLRHFAAGRVLNWHYEDASDAFTDSDDPAIFRVFGAMWPAYCDIRKHYMTGEHCLDKSGRAIVARYILFLHSDREYEWPVPGRWRLFLNLLTLGIWGLLNPLPQSGGDEAVWPFFRRSDLEEEAARPRLLAGSP
jgi:hypothetical protein